MIHDNDMPHGLACRIFVRPTSGILRKSRTAKNRAQKETSDNSTHASLLKSPPHGETINQGLHKPQKSFFPPQPPSPKNRDFFLRFNR
jgi:hypothetical protein